MSMKRIMMNVSYFGTSFIRPYMPTINVRWELNYDACMMAIKPGAICMIKKT